jgi:hypothetical protein
MKIAEFNVRCYLYWKKFLIPALSDFNYRKFLFVNLDTSIDLIKLELKKLYLKN